MLRIDPGQVLLADVQPGQEGQCNDAPARVPGQEPEDHEDVAVEVRRAGRTGGGVAADARPLDAPPVPLRRRVIQGDGQTPGPGDGWLDSCQGQSCGGPIGPLAGRRNSGVAGPELIAEPGGADPAGDGPPAASQDD